MLTFCVLLWLIVEVVVVVLIFYLLWAPQFRLIVFGVVGCSTGFAVTLVTQPNQASTVSPYQSAVDTQQLAPPAPATAPIVRLNRRPPSVSRPFNSNNNKNSNDFYYPPAPYAFEYVVNGPEGGHSRNERRDAAGRVTGSYTLQLADGRHRVVEYVADERGYRATVRTNEFGTESQNPADVQFISSALPAKEATRLGETDPAFKLYGPPRRRV